MEQVSAAGESNHEDRYAYLGVYSGPSPLIIRGCTPTEKQR